ncbi:MULTISPECIES: terminase small subunit [Peribacillus]|uniref:terminase small subunit n=1 Tax=Peribacillus TaxID=2675229 RepID=UPI002342F4DE|nr:MULTISPECIES: terminase small subunit [unclassified Peribacillus]
MNWENIRIEYESSNLTLKDLAEKHDIKLGTLKSRKSREGWSRDATKKDATIKKDATKGAKEATIKTKQVKVKEIIVEWDELTDKQSLFCLYYVKSFNATQAMIKAGYAPSSAHVEGHRLLRKPKIASEIKRIKSDMAQGVFIDAMDVLNKYIKIAFSDITDYLTFGRKEIEVGLDEDGEPVMAEVNHVDFKNSDAIDGSIIAEVKQGKEGVSIKLEDKMKALDKLSLYFDLFPDKFKREIESEKLKLAQRRVNGEDEEEYEDDGFLEALDGKDVVWDEEA